MSVFQKVEAHLGVDIGAGGIKLVELRKVKGRPQLWTYGYANRAMNIHEQFLSTEKTPEELAAEKRTKLLGTSSVTKEVDVAGPAFDERLIQEYGTLLKTIAQKSRVTTKRATASLPVSQVFHAIVTLPRVDKKELDFHVRAKVKKILPRPIEEMQVLHQDITDELTPDGLKGEKNNKDMRVLVTAAPLALIQFYSKIFAYAGIELEELETEAFALERSLVGHEKGVVMIVDIGSERTNFFIIDHGIPLIHRSIQIGGGWFDTKLQEYLGVDPGEAAQIKHDALSLRAADLPTDLFVSAIDPIIKEIQSSFDLFLHQSGNEAKHPEKIIFTGGAALFPSIVSSVREAFPLKVFIGDPWARVIYQQGLKRVLDGLGPRMAVAIGLAMRNIV